jgi:3-phenylpropionate/cinnamic acid dioxygenase small subunit
VNARAQAGSLAAGIELVHREARFLDEQRWDEWLALYLEDCEYWMPAWKADGTLTGNPKTELSLESPDDRLRLSSTWVCHVYFPRSRESHAFFGRTEHELVARESDWRITKKKILLQNDYIPTMLDVYCV